MRFHFPSLCFNDFYKDPDMVRDFALSLDGYSNKYGAHPGLRCSMLAEYDSDFYRQSVDKFMSLFDEWGGAGASFNCSTFFQKIHRYSSDPSDPVNQGWIHHDGNVDIAGVVYLDPKPVSDNGTSFYEQKVGNAVSSLPASVERILNGDNFRFNNVLDGDTPEYERIMGTSDDNTLCKIDDIDWYRENIVKNNEQFELTMEVKNCYNRCIVYSGQRLHSQSNYWMSNEDDFRLAQVFFVFDLKLPPNFITSSRLDNYDI